VCTLTVKFTAKKLVRCSPPPVIRGRLPAIGKKKEEEGRTPRSSTTARRPRARVGKRPWAGRSNWRSRAWPQAGEASRGRCTPAVCVGCAPRRACERRAAAAGWQVALAAAKFARLGV
jgi:hypothetical protein